MKGRPPASATAAATRSGSVGGVGEHAPAAAGAVYFSTKRPGVKGGRDHGLDLVRRDAQMVAQDGVLGGQQAPEAAVVEGRSLEQGRPLAGQVPRLQRAQEQAAFVGRQDARLRPGPRPSGAT